MRDFPNSYPKPDWLPDWRDETAYEDHGDDFRAWAWEFLRRNPEYQADYARWEALPDSVVAPDGTSGASPKYGHTIGLDNSMIYCHAETPALPGETVEEYESRTGGQARLFQSYLAEKWGVSFIESPANSIGVYGYDEVGAPPIKLDFAASYLDCGPRTKLFGQAHEYIAGRLLYAPWSVDDDGSMMTYGFDIRVSIPDQLRAVERALTEIKREYELSPGYEGKPRTGLGQKSSYIAWLRLLDAELTGATEEEIITEIYPGEAMPVPPGRGERQKQSLADEQARYVERGREWKRKTSPKAREFMETGWRRLLYWANLPTQPRNNEAKRRK